MKLPLQEATEKSWELGKGEELGKEHKLRQEAEDQPASARGGGSGCGQLCQAVQGTEGCQPRHQGKMIVGVRG